MTPQISPGQSYPLGATVYSNGVNFSLFSKSADAVELLLFDHPDASEPAVTIHLNLQHHKTFFYWHVFVADIGSGQIYAYRVHGPFEPEKGLRFDSSKVLLDPYVLAIVGENNYSRTAAITRVTTVPRL